MNLTSPISELPKIGPRYKSLLEKLEIRTVRDLLYHFPFRYEDFTQVKTVSSLMINDTATIRATLERVDNVFTRSRRNFTKAVFSDETGKIQAIWFNAPYIKNNLKIGETYNLSGKVTTFSGKLAFISPAAEPAGTELNTGRLVPIYPETAGVSSRWLRARINDILNSGIELQEFLPEKILKSRKFLELKSALHQIHFPETLENAVEAKKRFAFEELFMELLKVQNRKQEWENRLEAKPLAINQKQVSNLIENLPFSLSKSQNLALQEVFTDLASNRPMNRLLEGDTGSGKTVVAMISAYSAFLDASKTLFMAPTEILARQHFETFEKILGGFGVKVALKTSANKTGLKELKKADVIIGTHALIHLEENIPDVGLIVIDEQQRFGVEQRTKLIRLGTQNKIPHLLTMTATPIPRTLALTIYGDLEISRIEPPIQNRKNVTTSILSEKSREETFKRIREQNLPTFVICPLIDESEHETLANVKSAETEFAKLQKFFGKGNVGLLHGRMSAKEKLAAIEDFRGGRVKVLVATPVIEVGIDVPDASIIVIESAERYGLASLHQLRGRVGRAGQEAYCLVFSGGGREAFARLENLKKHDSGIKLAEIDMQTRGHGDLYGTAQHGYLNFKVADLSDVDLLEEAKEEATKILPELENYPQLLAHLVAQGSDLTSPN